MSNKMSVWQLAVEKSNGQIFSLCGAFEILSCEMDAWVEYQTAVAEAYNKNDDELDGVPVPAPRMIHGYSNTADRTDAQVCYLLPDVAGMSLVEQ